MASAGRSPSIMAGRSPSILAGRSPSILAGRSPSILAGRSIHTRLFSNRRIYSGNLSVQASNGSFFADGWTAKVIDGNVAVYILKEDIRPEVNRLKSIAKVIPTLAIINVGDENDCIVQSTKVACDYVGIQVFRVDLPKYSLVKDIIECIVGFNDNSSIHGIFVQLRNFCTATYELDILDHIKIDKDVGGLHPLVNTFLEMGEDPLYMPYAVNGSIELLHEHSIDLRNKKVVIVSPERTFVTTASLLLKREGAYTASWNHSGLVTKQADVVLSAVGKANIVEASLIKVGAVVVDFGRHRVEDANSRFGYQMMGDVRYDEVGKVASAITLPGAVDKMSIAVLLARIICFE